MEPESEDASGPQRYYLRRVLDTIFPSSYIHKWHKSPQSVYTVFNFKTCAKDAPGENEGTHDLDSLLRGNITCIASARDSSTADQQTEKLEASMVPMSRIELTCLRYRFEASLADAGAKPFGLCPLRRIIYDQMFDELIRQVTVSCIEQGLLLCRVRNELWHTIQCYEKAYESGVTFGLNKALRAELKLEEMGKLKEAEETGKASDSTTGRCSKETEEESELRNLRDKVTRLEAHFEHELAIRNQIIEQQRAFIRHLSQESIRGVESLVP